MKWWKIAGLIAYYAMFLNVGAPYGIVAFLFGLVFGEFWAEPRNQTNRATGLIFLLEMYFTTGFPLFIIVWCSEYLATPSGAANLQPTSKVFFSFAVILLVPPQKRVG